MSTYQSKDSQVQARQLEAQSIVAVCNVVAGTSDLPALVVIDNSTIADSTIEIDVKEQVEKVFIAQVTSKATGANVALEAVTIDGSKIKVQVDGTGLSSACLQVTYKIKE